jgi:monovalent cation/hydrogen antiporter
MGDVEVTLVALLVSVVVLAAAARAINVPYPIVLVVGGALLGVLPIGMPEVELDPDLVLIIFLPPLLYSGAFFANLRDLRADLRAITLLSVGLVLATVVVVAAVAHALIDGLSWPAAFVLGAIVGPTDPVAATAIARRLGVPRRIVSILEGESLVNDATALVAYRIAVAAAVGETVSAGGAVTEFLREAGGGIAIGLAAGWVISQIRRRVTDVNTELTISLFSAYGAFVPADQAGASGVLAVVACGVYLCFRAPEIASPESRMQGEAMWGILAFLLNAALFILIGLQLPTIMDGLGDVPTGELLGDAAAVCAAVILTRYVWQFALTALIRAIDRRPSQRARRATWRFRIVGGWAGMRGAVSLAAALALPLQTDDGAPLPGRDLIQFCTFALILVTVVGQGLTLPWLIRALGVVEDPEEEQGEELRARLGIAAAALERVDELAAEDWTREDSIERVRRLYEFRMRRFKIRAGKLDDDDDGSGGGIEERSLRYQRMMHEVYAAQRRALIDLRDDRVISSDVLRRVEREIDLEESRLEV